MAKKSLSTEITDMFRGVQNYDRFDRNIEEYSGELNRIMDIMYNIRSMRSSSTSRISHLNNYINEMTNEEVVGNREQTEYNKKILEKTLIFFKFLKGEKIGTKHLPNDNISDLDEYCKNELETKASGRKTKYLEGREDFASEVLEILETQKEKTNKGKGK
ncbi:hypothetical protein M0R19_08190 [Candidatus Pacearchaeota archaeon]|nr:hypothetical protein [bacterium]MCK9597137.1 hypothetical protein [Candidatus Pacearchaeota archaeon]